MPYKWITSPLAEDGRSPQPVRLLMVWPQRSLPRRGFAGVIGGAAAFALLPLLMLLGSPVLWVMLPFLLAMLAGLWLALSLSYRTGEVREELWLFPDRVHLRRCEPNRPVSSWDANPHWTRMRLHPTGGPVPHYLTLHGEGRTVEVGAFLREDERLELGPEIEEALNRLGGPQLVPLMSDRTPADLAS